MYYNILKCIIKGWIVSKYLTMQLFLYTVKFPRNICFITWQVLLNVPNHKRAKDEKNRY